MKLRKFPSLILGLATLMYVSCTGKVDGPSSDDSSKTVEFTVTDPYVLEGHTAVVYEVIDDRKIEKMRPEFISGKAEVAFNLTAGGWHRYYLLVNDLDNVDNIVVGGGSHPIYRAASQEFKGRPESVSFATEKLSATFELKLEGLDSKQVVTSVKVEFPKDTYVSSRYSFNAIDGGTLKATPLGTIAECDVSNGSSRTVWMDIAPCRIVGGTAATVTVNTTDDSYTGTVSFTQTQEIKERETCKATVNLDNTKYFANPVISVDWADPTIWQDGKRFYTIATGIGSLMVSRDLVNWSKFSSQVLTPSALSSAQAAGKYFWAPDVCKIGDRWMLYLTCYNSASDCGIFAFSSTSASGPFEYVGKITHSKDTGIQDTIDADVVVDESTGKVWLFFGSIGKVHRVQLNSTGTALADGAKYTHVAGLTYAENTSRSKVFEGSYLHRHDGWWYLFVSSGNYSNASYMLKVGRSRTLDGTFFDKDGKSMTAGNATVVLSSTTGDTLYGPGHNGDIFTDADGQDYMFYHCHDSGINNTNRFTFLQRLYWGEDGWPYFEGGKPLREDKAPRF